MVNPVLSFCLLKMIFTEDKSLILKFLFVFFVDVAGRDDAAFDDD